MLNTPTGMRCPEESEMVMLSFGASKLAHYIAGRIRAEEKKTTHEGVLFKSVKEESAFHALIPRAQLVLLATTIQVFFDPQQHHQINQFYNSTLECIYSCLFYEVKREIERQGQGIPNRRSRNNVYYAWEYWFHEKADQDPANRHLTTNSINVDEWIGVLDKLAARTVFDQNYAKQFDPGHLPDITDQLVGSAAIYLEQLGTE